MFQMFQLPENVDNGNWDKIKSRKITVYRYMMQIGSEIFSGAFEIKIRSSSAAKMRERL